MGKKKNEIKKPDLYSLIKVNRDADVTEIRKAYFRLALKVHPDKNLEDPDASTNFAALQQAYE